MINKNNLKLACIWLSIAFALSGCMAAVVGEAVNGSMAEKLDATIDNGTFDQTTKDLLGHSKRVGIVAGPNDEVSAKFAEVFTAHNFKVNINRVTTDPDKLSPDERKNAQAKSCHDGNDVGIVGFMGDSTPGNSALIWAGRRVATTSWHLEIMNCHGHNNISTVTGTITSNAGTVSGSWSAQEVVKRGSEKVANLLLDGIPARDTQASAMASPSQNAITSSTMTVAQAQSILNSLGFNVGTADGVMGKKTRDQIKAFQKSRGIPQSGKIDEQTIAELNKPV